MPYRLQPDQEKGLRRLAKIPDRAAATAGATKAGILFSVLFVSSHSLVWLSIPADPSGPPEDVIIHGKTISLALELLPFVGIAFLWFVRAPYTKMTGVS